jgi:hypothetical protein
VAGEHVIAPNTIYSIFDNAAVLCQAENVPGKLLPLPRREIGLIPKNRAGCFDPLCFVFVYFILSL